MKIKTIIYLIVITIITNKAYSYNSKEINNFYNDYYSSNYDIKVVENNLLFKLWYKSGRK